MKAKAKAKAIAAAIIALLIMSIPSATATTGPDESKLRPNAVHVSRYVEQHYPEVPEIGGARPDRLPDHPSGHAVDIMIPYRELGDRILADLHAHAAQLGIRYTIWQQRLWKPNGVSYMMRDKGSPRQNHRDHIHVTVF